MMRFCSSCGKSTEQSCELKENAFPEQEKTIADITNQTAIGEKQSEITDVHMIKNESSTKNTKYAGYFMVLSVLVTALYFLGAWASDEYHLIYTN